MTRMQVFTPTTITKLRASDKNWPQSLTYKGTRYQVHKIEGNHGTGLDGIPWYAEYAVCSGHPGDSETHYCGDMTEVKEWIRLCAAVEAEARESGANWRFI